MPVDPEQLRGVPLFTDLTDTQRDMIAAKLEERTVNSGTRLTSEGGPGYFFFVIESGAAVVTRDGVTLAEFGPGDFFGEATIFKVIRRTATVTTTAPSVVFEMFGADFALLTSQIPELQVAIEAAMAKRLPN